MHIDAEHTEGFAYEFYVSDVWRKCRRAYLEKVGGLCERCKARGIIRKADHVHHRERLTRKNINDPSISLSWENLEALCEDCHREEHHPTRWRCDADGRIDLSEGSPQGAGRV